HNAQISVYQEDETINKDIIIESVGEPYGQECNREQRGVQILRDAQHLVDQAAEQDHVGAHRLGAALFLRKDGGGQPLDAAQHIVLRLEALLVGQVAGALFQDDLARVEIGRAHV